MSDERGSPIAQKNDNVQNGDSWFSLTPPGTLILPRSAPVPVDMPGNQRNRTWQDLVEMYSKNFAPVPIDMPGNQRTGTWQDLLGMYSQLLNQDVADQTPNQSSVTSITSIDFDLLDVVAARDQHLDRNACAYVQNFSNDSAGSCKRRAAEVIGTRTKENKCNQKRHCANECQNP